MTVGCFSGAHFVTSHAFLPAAPEEHGELLLCAIGDWVAVVVVAARLFGLLLGEEEVVLALLARLAQRQVVLVAVVAGPLALK